MATVGLGLTAGPAAEASCAGPQLGLQQNGGSIEPRRVGEGPDEQLLYDVDRAQPLQVVGTNLTVECQDTIATPGGCGAPVPSANPPEPLRDAELRIIQSDNAFTLTRLDVGSDLSSHVEVALPARVRPGSARLTIHDPAHGDSAELHLVLR